MHLCDICEAMGLANCIHCYIGNPCLGCKNYDEKNDVCTSNEGCTQKEE